MKKFLFLIWAFSLFACEKLENAAEPEIGKTESKVGKADSAKLGKVAEDYYSYDVYRSINSGSDYLRVDYFSLIRLSTYDLTINPDQQLVWHFRPKFNTFGLINSVQIRVIVYSFNDNCTDFAYYSPWTTISGDATEWKYGDWSAFYDLNTDCTNGVVRSAQVEIQGPDASLYVSQVSVEFESAPAGPARSASANLDLSSKPATETVLPE